MSGSPGNPQRTCVGCRRRTCSSALVRVTDGAHGIVVDGPSDGRGAWLCRNDRGGPSIECVELGIRRRGFARAWRRNVDHDELRRGICGT